MPTGTPDSEWARISGDLEFSKILKQRSSKMEHQFSESQLGVKKNNKWNKNSNKNALHLGRINTAL